MQNAGIRLTNDVQEGVSEMCNYGEWMAKELTKELTKEIAKEKQELGIEQNQI